MIIGIGTDIIEVDRIKKSIENYGDRFRKKIFSNKEIEYCEQFNDQKWVHYAARFAAKESFSKAIGTGITNGFKFNEISILNEQSGKPYILLDGNMLQSWGHCNALISLSHTRDNAIAYIILEVPDK